MSKSISKTAEYPRPLHKNKFSLLWHLGCFFATFFMARCPILNQTAPFGVGLAAGLPGEYGLSSALGGLMGYWFPLGESETIHYMGATALAGFLAWILNGYISLACRPLFSAIFSGGSVLGMMLLLLLAGEGDFSVVSIIGDSCLAAGTAYFFANSSSLFPNVSKPYSTRELTAGAIAITLLLTSLYSLQYNDISPARILAIVLILLCAYHGKEAFGTIAGVAVALSVYLADPDSKTVALALCLGGLVAGLCVPLQKIGVCVGFLLANGFLILPDYHPLWLPHIYESVTAIIIFMVLPAKLTRPLCTWLSYDHSTDSAKGLRDNIVLRLSFAGEAVRDVSQTVEEVATRLKRLNAPTFERVFQRTEQDACQSCSMRIFCWESNRGETLSALLKGVKQLRKDSTIETKDLPESFVKQCLHPTRVIDGLTRHFSDYLIKDAAERRLDEIRQVIAEQFQGVSDMLIGLSEEFRTDHQYDRAVCEELRSAFLNMGVEPMDISCQIDRYQHLTAEIRLDAKEEQRIHRSVLMRTLKETCGRKFEVPTITPVGDTLLLTLSEQAEFSVDFGVAQFSFQDNKLCGDAYHSFFDGRGRFVMIISDGMGKGGRAAVDGVMASGLMARLLKAGFAPNSALKIVNSAMLYKSTDESLATIDVTVLDLFGGRAEFFKAGAPATLLRRNGKAAMVLGENLPAGILQGVEFDYQYTTLTQGDIVVMMSDGALGDGTDWIGVELEVWKRGNAQALAEHLADYARRRCPNGHGDDITIAVAILEKGY